MVFGAALAAFLSVQSDSGIEQLQLLMSSSRSFEFKCRTKVNESPVMNCVTRWQVGVAQQYQVDRTFELRQTDEALILTDHKSKDYQEYRGFGFPTPPDAKHFFDETLAYPWFFVDFAKTLKAIKANDWKSVKEGEGWKLSGNWSSDISLESVDLTLNGKGAPIRIVRTIQMEQDKFVIVHEVDSLTGLQEFPPLSLHPEPGYLPTGVVNYFTPSPGDAIRNHPILEPDGQAAEMATLMGKKGMTLFFTAPDCQISTGASADLAALKAELDRAGYPLIEISLGKTKPGKGFSGGRLFWDSNENLERRWAIASTPYFISIDKSNTVIGVWEGWWTGCRAEALKTLSETGLD